MSTIVQNFFTMDLVDSFRSLPVFTRSWLGLTFAITAAITLDVISPDQIILDWRCVINTDLLRNHGHVELWRILTSFCYCGAPLDELYSIILLFMIYTHSHGYEKNPFPAGSGSRTADTLFSVLFCAIFLLCTHPIPGYLLGPNYELYPILTRNLNCSLLYLWSKRNPYAMIQLNFVPMEGRYLPFAHILISLFMNNRLHELLHGFATAHIYYFLIAVAPMLLGRQWIIRTPQILVEMIGEGGNTGPEDGHQTQMEREILEFRERDNASPAHVAAKLGHLSHLRNILLATSAGRRRRLLTASDRNGWQPLHEACRGGHTEIVRYLLVEQGQYVDARATTNNGMSPLSLSQEYHGEDHPLTQLLLDITTLNNISDSEENRNDAD